MADGSLSGPLTEAVDLIVRTPYGSELEHHLALATFAADPLNTFALTLIARGAIATAVRYATGDPTCSAAQLADVAQQLALELDLDAVMDAAQHRIDTEGHTHA